MERILTKLISQQLTRTKLWRFGLEDVEIICAVEGSRFSMERIITRFAVDSNFPLHFEWTPKTVSENRLKSHLWLVWTATIDQSAQMIALIWISHAVRYLFRLWLVDNGYLRQHFSLYRAVPQKEGEREDKTMERKNPHELHRIFCKNTRPLPNYYPN